MLRKALTGLIRAYAYVVSPLMGPKCRFYPTCSAYAAEAIERHGAGKGLILAIKRLFKCHPYYHGAMLDPVPQSIDWAGLIGYNRKACNGCQTHDVKEEK